MKKTKVLSLTTLLLALGLAGCGEKEAPKVDPCEKHTWGEYEVTKEATCKEAGSKKRVCTVCATEDVKEIAKKTTHTYTVTSETPADCTKAGSKVETCSVCNDVKTTPLAKLDHQYVTATDSTHTATTATCSVKGSHWEKCSKCNDWKKVEEGFADHSWGAYSADVVVDGNTTYKKRTCSACSAVDVTISALNWVKIEGSNKDSTGATLKLNKNNDYVEYKFNLGGAFTGKVYFYGWVDRVGGSDNNETKGFFTVKNSDHVAGNFSLAVNESEPIEITNKATYAEMGMRGSGIKVTDAGVVSDNNSYERATETLCEVGAIAIPAGDATIKYTRVDSYNLNLIEMHFIGTIAA